MTQPRGELPTPTSQPDPLALPQVQQIFDHFFPALAARDFDTCRQLLERFAQTAITAEERQICLYGRAILHNEENRWDLGETELRRLLSQPLHPNLAQRIWNALGIAIEHLGRLDEAAETYARAQAVAEGLGDTLYWAKIAKNRAICTVRGVENGLVEMDALPIVRRELQRTVEIFHEAGEPILEGRSWNELGATFKATGEWAQALECYAKDQAICQAQDDRHGLAASLNNSGEALNGLGRFAEAEALLAQAAAGFAATGDAYEQADALTNWADALAGQGRVDAASQRYAQATACVEAVRGELGSHAARVDFFGTQTRIYGRRLAHALRAGKDAEAFAVAEQARARGMRELLGNRVPEAAPLTAADALALLPADTGLLAWFALENELVGFALSHTNGLRVSRLPISPAQIFNGSFDGLGLPRSLMPDPSARLTVPWLLPHLYDHLLAPLLPACRRLVLVPHGNLHWLPLHAACNRATGHHLCEEFDLLYAPSAAIQLAQLQPRRTNSERTGTLALACEGRGLRYVEAEVADVARLGGGRALIGAGATSQSLREEAHRFRWLHLAGHAHYTPHAPLQSGVDLADGRLSAEKLMAGPELGFALAWVNGCESGRAAVGPGDELLGFIRGLLAGMAPSLLLTLWPVNDLAARVFARLFYTALAQNDSPNSPGVAAVLARTAAAMRRFTWDELRHLLREDGHTETEIDRACASLPRQVDAAADSPPFDHPYFWAAYFLVGEVWD